MVDIIDMVADKYYLYWLLPFTFLIRVMFIILTIPIFFRLWGED